MIRYEYSNNKQQTRKLMHNCDAFVHTHTLPEMVVQYFDAVVAVFFGQSGTSKLEAVSDCAAHWVGSISPRVRRGRGRL